MRKITVNRKDKALTKMELRHRYVPWKLLRFLTVIFNGVFQKFISTDRQIFNISNKVTSMIIYRSSQRRCSVRKGFLRNCSKVTAKYLCQSLQSWVCNFINIETPAQVLSYKFCEISKNTFFTEYVWAAASKYKETFYAFDLKGKIFKVSGFFYKLNRKLLYRNCTIYYLENSNVIFHNFSEWLLLKIPQQLKTCSKSTALELLQ